VEVVIEHKFRGPSGSANGGYTCGVLASFMHGPAEVTVRLPPPLERRLDVEIDGGLRLLDGEAVVAEAVAAELGLDVPEPVSFEQAAAAALPVGDRESAFPECFVCGWKREDGMRIYAGPVEGHELVAATHIEMHRVGGRRRGHDDDRVAGVAGDLVQFAGQTAADPRGTERLGDVKERELSDGGPQMRHHHADPDQPSVDEGAEGDPPRFDVVLEVVPLCFDGVLAVPVWVPG